MGEYIVNACLAFDGEDGLTKEKCEEIGEKKIEEITKALKALGVRLVDFETDEYPERIEE